MHMHLSTGSTDIRICAGSISFLRIRAHISVMRFARIDQKVLLEEGTDGHRKTQRQN